MPPGVDPAHHHVRSCALVLAPDVAFKDGAKDALNAKRGVAQTTV
jgi:phthalate 4,5-dioxygenase oxygenase subunit